MIMEIKNQAGRRWNKNIKLVSRKSNQFQDWGGDEKIDKRVFLVNRWRLFCRDHQLKVKTPQNNAKVKVEKWAIWSENTTRSVKGPIWLVLIQEWKDRSSAASSGQSWEIWRFFSLNQWILKYFTQNQVKFHPIQNWKWNWEKYGSNCCN